ncbi:hypothetical protein HYQ45_014630 [Verticillium longisporum]|uniref:Uncharacterized protein n=1 Tax=Verticillium longisporum TaxID=100787 RepID=A0A8I2Z8B0_VERLO|nr:hypothetical protein HYQ45_014630 [Verticillium longisporum]
MYLPVPASGATTVTVESRLGPAVSAFEVLPANKTFGSSTVRRFLPFKPRLAFGRLKGNRCTTAPAAVSFVSDQDFSVRKSFHITNNIPPPAPAHA